MIQFLARSLSRVRTRPTHLLYLFIIALSLFAAVVFRYSGFTLGIDIAIGCILSATHAFLGYVTFERQLGLSHSAAILFSLAGGMIRFMLILMSIVLILLILPIGVGGFIASFMVSYVAFMIPEIARYHRLTSRTTGLSTRS